MLAGLLYLGAGVGVAAVHVARAAIGLSVPEAPPRRHDVPWLIAIVIFGGILGPALLMFGLGRTPASSGSLMLNLESLATMGITWLVFRENVDRRLLSGALAIVLGAIALSWEGQGPSLDAGAALIAAACLCWGIDNNLTRKLSSADPVIIAMIKGLFAGAANIVGGFWLGNSLRPRTSSLGLRVLACAHARSHAKTLSAPCRMRESHCSRAKAALQYRSRPPPSRPSHPSPRFVTIAIRPLSRARVFRVYDKSEFR